VPAKWINKRRRARIYARDGFRCVYCDAGAGPAEKQLLSLDHLRPVSKGGTNSTGNLVTACKSCNSARQNRSVRSFCIAVAAYTLQDWRVIWFRVRAARKRSVPQGILVEKNS
jgi:hypothetical protein